MNRTDKTPSSPAVFRRSSFAALLLVASQCAVAETFVVTRNDDPAPNGCLPGDCSLREAISASNANANSDLIQVPAGNYGLPRGKLVLTGPVEIYGSNEGTTKVEGDGISQVFDILGAITVTLASMTIQAHGAHAVDAEPDSRTFLDFVTIPDNDSQVWAGDTNNSIGTLAVRGSEIHSSVNCGSINACRVQQGSQISRLNAGSGSNSQTLVTITDSIIDGDLAVGGSGAVIATSGEVTIANTTIQHASLGLQILYGSPSQITLDHLDYNANDLPVFVGGAPVSVVDSTFRNNISTDPDGAPAAIHARGASVWAISGSSFVGNSGNGTVGGAVLVEDAAHVSILNSTFSGNTFTAASAAGARGAAVGFRSNVDITNLLLQHVTIVAPAFGPAGILGTALGGEGGESGLVLTVLNSIIRGSCSLDANAMDVNSGNIESSGDTCDFGSGNNQVSVSSGSLDIGSLADHGGATPTYVPGSLSLAVDAANPAFCLGTDQRGYARPFGENCDVGAVEVGADFLFADGFE